MGELIAYAVFGGYFALIGLSFLLVGRSIVDRIPEWKRLAEGRAFLFLRVAVAALGTTWYCELSPAQLSAPGNLIADPWQS